ncbi:MULTISPECIES: SDR family oxidoreductase [unclassified Oceanobacter]|jgi:NAD(P)-dependent dehydrogenase (short-subunit alcohol dehydrogenase family)|uniref:SDR family oxidoreductase n=1 Tax=unclassified Oceanobacter TaxID=2620260 RepID=UPI0026E24F15|nr:MULTISPECIES: SDR family oxidoreductase [unclassified Oceanobacter]MDO6681504.1 SDR family oxidoreductase [Oceanobacter sp. 5_MG-2023]MDP2506659.1 SDR family oxidoreductase [Oceanobacter sp. 3_MG-2023]MDP2548674.1 SDR family oxidoreductase [Oceanobacter sp. 4_MG-2023]MDP2609263.1 SDR family oxidoreductase [Oceanobacter sp. 1_MG-2023]MDP2612640.1 SDR family oxidoreductase [Oceanobacter sp. 2_MG-2023]
MANVLITGANRGIGLELVRHFSSRGDCVMAVCRESSEALDTLADQIITGIDMTDAEAVQGLQTIVAELLDGPLDLLVNNAGIFANDTLDQLDFEQISRQFEVNTLAPLRLVHTLLPLMCEGSKIANITSRMGSMADNGSGGYYGYRASKAALNAFGKSLAEDLRPRGIAVAQLHPGFVQTRMVNFAGDISPQQAAEGLVARIDELTISNSGGFWHSNGQPLPW